MPKDRLPLDGIRVLDITLVWAGPYGTQLMADWGAEVIRLEPIDHFQPMGRGMHAKVTKAEVQTNKNWNTAYPGWDPGARPWNRTPSFNVHARNKKSVTVNLTAPGGRDVLDKLVAVSDVLVENNVPTTSDKLGLSYERISKINPEIVVINMPGFGLNGPYRGYRTLGSHIDGISSHATLRGYPDLGLESQTDIYFSDTAGGANCALAVLMALRHRRRTGRGQLIELAQVENYTSYLSDVTMDYIGNGRIQKSLGNRHGTMVPHGCYPCLGEDQWIMISVATEEQWDGLLKAMAKPSWASERRFATYLNRYTNQDEVDALLSSWTKHLDKMQIMHLLQKEGVPAGPVLDHSEVFASPQLKNRKFFQEVSQVGVGTYAFPSIIGKLSETPNAIRTPPPLLGEHNEYVYKEVLGYSEAEYQGMERLGHISGDYHSHVQ